ncbi:hypothetical protein HOLDEFILI_01558 [Holdemania filiformis DSM 12042]|uniref:Uncharacterized protein n=1 Tax=Holdemania filiformis DSM 12042 TaxID=545696 RepID=B9Y6W6_9FIRM|nr:hypothetical protein HOLDEFILI_01558 [Holdemania filiformis DSM 12042]
MLFSLLNSLFSVFPFHYNKIPGKNERKCRNDAGDDDSAFGFASNFE